MDLPSGWTAMACAVPSPTPISKLLVPSPAKVASSVPDESSVGGVLSRGMARISDGFVPLGQQGDQARDGHAVPPIPSHCQTQPDQTMTCGCEVAKLSLSSISSRSFITARYSILLNVTSTSALLLA